MGKFDLFSDFHSNMDFSVICLQEVWSLYKDTPLQGFQPLVYNTRDMNSKPNPNCGGGTAIYVKYGVSFTKIEPKNSFIPNVYESTWIEVTLQKKKLIIGSIYRPNTAPKANLTLALKTHFDILNSFKSNNKYKKHEIHLWGT